ncbi:DUF7534 family protein [Halosolutus gelatinilyticus]|uniref:DUF7534 family protein n=1 Tax=Halosolutus gelatinilyticus TaxID=2931975 RepID=UPI001FF5F3B9|nr:hypothetical protein [Halosolutus gelatinilyticus]
MESRAARRFLHTTLMLSVLAVMAATIAAPPDPFTMLSYAVPLVVLAPVASYLLTFRGWFAAIDAGE